MTTQDKKILEATRWEEIQAVMNQNQDVYAVLDFWAPWCAPCMQLSPHFYEMATNFAERPYVFSKVNVDDPEAEEFTSKFSVSSLPTILVVDAKGKEVKRVIGRRPDAIRNMIETLPSTPSITTTTTTPIQSLLSAPPSSTPSIFDNPYRI
jgi:thioredoxin-like negative regulator of GroEL